MKAGLHVSVAAAIATAVGATVLTALIDVRSVIPAARPVDVVMITLLAGAAATVVYDACLR